MNRRSFLVKSGTAAVLTGIFNSFPDLLSVSVDNIGVQLYSFRDAMQKSPKETLALIADIGFREIETARSPAGHYYGLEPEEMMRTCRQLGMNLRSGHVHLDNKFEETMEEALLAGQEYLICSSLPTRGQTIDNYKRVAEAFNQAGEACWKNGIKFGYHNHDYEFEKDGETVLFDVLMDQTDPNLVHMELDLGWVVAAGSDPLDYFKRYPGRFPLWHLKDMNLMEKESTEFGRGAVDIPKMLDNMAMSGVQYIFVEQEEYAHSPEDSMRHNLKYLSGL